MGIFPIPGILFFPGSGLIPEMGLQLADLYECIFTRFGPVFCGIKFTRCRKSNRNLRKPAGKILMKQVPVGF